MSEVNPYLTEEVNPYLQVAEEPSLLKKIGSAAISFPRKAYEEIALPFAENLTSQAVGLVDAGVSGVVATRDYLQGLAGTGSFKKAYEIAKQGVEETPKISSLFTPKTELGKSSSEISNKIWGIPGEVGEELVDLPLQSWKVPEHVRQPVKAVTGLAMYGVVGAGGGLAKNIVKSILKERGYVKPQVTFTAEQILSDRVKFVKENLVKESPVVETSAVTSNVKTESTAVSQAVPDAAKLSALREANSALPDVPDNIIPESVVTQESNVPKIPEVSGAQKIEVPKITFKEFITSKGVEWPITPKDPRYRPLLTAYGEINRIKFESPKVPEVSTELKALGYGASDMLGVSEGQQKVIIGSGLRKPGSAAEIPPTPEGVVLDKSGGKGIAEGLKDMGKHITDDLYNKAFEVLQNNKTTISGIKDPILTRAKDAYDSGLIKSPEDLKKYEAEGYPETLINDIKAEQKPLTFTKPSEEALKVAHDKEVSAKTGLVTEKIDVRTPEQKAAETPVVVKPGTPEYNALSAAAYEISQKEKAGTATPEDLVRKQELYKLVGLEDKPVVSRTREEIRSELEDAKQTLQDHQKDFADAKGDVDTQASIKEDIVDAKAEIAILNKELKAVKIEIVPKEVAVIKTPVEEVKFIEPELRMAVRVGDEIASQPAGSSIGADYGLTKSMQEAQKNGAKPESGWVDQSGKWYNAKEGKKIVNEQLGQEAERRANVALSTVEDLPPKGTTGVMLRSQKGSVGKDISFGATSEGPFYSQFEKIVQLKMGGKMEVGELHRIEGGKYEGSGLKKMLYNNGVTPAEIGKITRGMEGVVTKQQVLEEIKVNGMKFEDVVLGEKRDLYKLSDQEVIAKYNSEYGGSTRLSPDSLRDIMQHDFPNETTQFSSYQEPGSTPGSYREMFVTAPGKGEISSLYEKVDRAVNSLMDSNLDVKEHNWQYENVFASYHVTEQEYIKYKERLKESPLWSDGHSAYSGIQNPIVRIRYNDREINGKKILFVEEMQGPSGDTKWVGEARGKDSTGKDLYDRKLFDTKEQAEEWTKNRPFPTEEIQVSKTVMGEQGKMPPALRSRLYDIGVKRVLALAKEGRYDGIAWTPGEMQAKRYSLEQSVNSIGWAELPSGDKRVHINLKEARAGGQQSEFLTITSDGKVLTDGPFENKKINEVIGKEIGKKIVEDSTGNLSGLDLKVGGEGLKSLYDKTIPEKFKKYGKEGVGETELSIKQESGLWHRVQQTGNNYEVLNTITGRRAGEFRTEAEANTRLNELNYLEDKKVSVHYTPITSKTPRAYTLYSGLDITQLPTVLRGLTRTAKEGWQKLEDTSRSVKGASEGTRKSIQGLKEGMLSPEVIMQRDPMAKATFKELARAEEASNVFVDKHFNDYLRATQGIKKDSVASANVGKALDKMILPDTLTKQERKAYDFMKQDYETLINNYARREAGSEEAYQRILRVVAAVKPKEAAVGDLSPDLKTEYTALKNQQRDIRGTKKISDLPVSDRAEYADIKQRISDVLNKAFKKTLTEGEVNAYDIMSRKMSDYLPHLFDKADLMTAFKDEIKDITSKLNKTTNQAAITKFKNRLNLLEDAVKKTEGGELITFRQLPTNLFFRFFSPRTGKEGYSFDALRAYETYLHGITRKMFDEPAIKTINRDYFGKIDPSLRQYTQELVDHYLGKDRDKLDWLAGRITSFEWMRTLGLNPRSAIANLGQRINTVVSIGEKYSLQAEKMMLFDRQKANEIFNKSGIAREVPQVMAEGVMPAGMERVRAVVGYMFNKVELGNRKHAYLSGYLKVLEEGKKAGLTGETLETKAQQFGTDTVHKTQYRYGKLGSSKWSRHGVGRVALQFTSYPIKTAEFLYDLAKNNPIAFMKYFAYTEGINYAAQELFDTDLSNALGFGITWGEALKTIAALGSGDTRAAWRHAKQTVQSGGGMLPSGFGPAVSSAGKIGVAITKGQGAEQTVKELSPVIANRLKQAYDAYKEGDNGEYPIKDSRKHPMYRVNTRQLIQRTIGPKVNTESKSSRAYVETKNLEQERKEILSDVVDALLDDDIDKAGKLIDQYGIAPSSAQLKNELIARLTTRGERPKVGKPEMYQLQREGRFTNR